MTGAEQRENGIYDFSRQVLPPSFYYALRFSFVQRLRRREYVFYTTGYPDSAPSCRHLGGKWKTACTSVAGFHIDLAQCSREWYGFLFWLMSVSDV